MAERDLVVRFIGDDRHLQQAFTRSERRAGQFDSRMTKLNQSLRGGLTGFGSRSSLLFGSGAFLSTAGITAFTKKAIDSASDLEEQMNKVGVVFEDAGSSVQEWSETTASELGIAQREALAAAGTFGNLFSVIDIAPARAAEMSQALVQLAADLASFNNASPEEVLTAIRSGLIGEAEPLRRYGVLLSEARVQQVAFANTGKDNVKTLTDQEKAFARYEIILKDTATAQGDFARTSDGLANQTRILKANVDDLSASLGGVLLPFLNNLTTGANEGIGAIRDLAGAVNALGGEGFEKANANFAELVGRVAEIQDLNASFVAPELDVLAEQIRTVGTELNRVGATTKLINSFRQASEEIDQALQDGVITPLEAAQLETTELGRLFLDLVPENVLTGLAADVRSGIEDATAAARVGVEDLGAEIRSGIEDASRQAAIAARQGGENVGDSFVQGLQAASGRIEGQLAGLSEQVIRAQIAGDDRAEVVALQEQKRRLEALLRKQEQIVAAGGTGAATARKRIRDNILPQLLAVSNAIERGLNERERAMDEVERQSEEQTRRDKERIRRIADNQQEAAEAARAAARSTRRGNQFEALGLTEGGDTRAPGVGALRRRLRTLREQVRGTALDTDQTQKQLDRIKRVLSGKFGEVGRDVRNAILQMFNDIASAMKEGDARIGGERESGEITRGGIRSTQRLLRGLDLTDEERRIIQQRNLGVSGRRGFSAFGVGLVPSSGTAGSIDRRLQQTETFVIQNLTVVTNDPNDLMKKLQKKARRSSGGRRGRHGGANLGMQ